MLKQITLLLGLGIIATTSTHAGIDLATALYSKKVCERADGFIQATPGNELEFAGLVDQVNAKRTRVYRDIALKDGLSPTDVGFAMAEQEKAANPGKFCK